jgi:hypothetical protein
MEQEIYKPILSFETYAISNYGNIKDLRTGNQVPKSPNVKTGGYLQVSLRNPDKYHTFRIHKLVANHFMDNPYEYEEIDHIDRDVKNNNVSNLRWCNHSMNQINKLYIHSNNPYKNIHYEETKLVKLPYSCWRIIVRNTHLKFSKRYRVDEYSLDDVKHIRDELFRLHHIPILD